MLFADIIGVFLAMGGTVVVYGLIFISLRAKARDLGQTAIRPADSNPAVVQTAMKYVIVFPIVYVVCTCKS